MSDPKNDKDERKLTAYERWELPHLENNQPKTHTGPAILVEKESLDAGTEEVDQESLVYEPLTASQLEEIRSAAYDEGFIQGEEEGHTKGHEDGFAKGEVDGFEKGHEEGRLAGLEEGLAQAKADAETKLVAMEALLAQVVEEITHPLEESRNAAEAILYQSMTRLIENVCLSTMAENGHHVLREQLTKVFDEISEFQGRVRLRLHPDDVAVLEEFAVSDRLTLQIEKDNTLISGGFVIDSKSFHIDGRVEQRLDAVCAELRQLMHSDQD
ncbi:flagellar assembly protein FliH [Marinomonas sp. A79]|uniref:Flagellar assembly protein FliH n=1 Tax=Marinomonas vulgaris TaxID=2823372 RepID=A0ABS5HAM7_9GAMM|nr:FliH/SctL family protein [Marinomonas vulgaris]MBR7888695.1 flagellar assembly protein FliH [Marinomonas vulgaris]